MKLLLNGFYLQILPPRELWRDDNASYDAHITAIQRLRGAVYLQDEAIPHEVLDAEGKHHSEWDERSYHICIWAENETLAGCLRLTVHSQFATAENICLAPALGRMPLSLQSRAKSTLDKLIKQARQDSLGFGELGGWAVETKYRRNRNLWSVMLATYSLHEHLGSLIVVIHATHRHRSVEILKQLGATLLADAETPLPTHFDSYYNCDMEILCFDSRKPPERFRPVISAFLAALRWGHRRIDSTVFEKYITADGQ